MARSVKLKVILSCLLITLLLAPSFAFGDVTASSALDSGLMFNLVKLPSLEWKAQTGFQIGYRLFLSSNSIFNRDNFKRPFHAGFLFRVDYFSFGSSALLSDGNLYRGFHGYGLGLGASLLFAPEAMTIFNVQAAFVADASAQIRVSEYLGTSLAGAQIAGTGSFGIRLSEVFRLENRTFNLLVRVPFGYTTMAGASMISAGLSLGFELGNAPSRDERAP